jgi:hypothetical protein
MSTDDQNERRESRTAGGIYWGPLRLLLRLARTLTLLIIIAALSFAALWITGAYLLFLVEPRSDETWTWVFCIVVPCCFVFFRTAVVLFRRLRPFSGRFGHWLRKGNQSDEVAADAKPAREPFQFRLRTLFVAVIVCALLLTAWPIRDARTRCEEEAAEKIKAAGGTEDGWQSSGADLLSDLLMPFGEDRSPWPPRGGKYYRICGVSFRGAHINDEDFTQMFPSLKRLRCLRSLDFSGTRITDETLALLGREKLSLDCLQCAGTPITDDGIRHLTQLRRVLLLNLSGTRVTDRCIDDLISLPGIRTLWLTGTAISQEGLLKLRRALPHANLRPEPDIH